MTTTINHLDHARRHAVAMVNSLRRLPSAGVPGRAGEPSSLSRL